MSVITFINNFEEETGKSLSSVAIATYLGINNNNNILLIATTDKVDKINSCFFEESRVTKLRKGMFGNAGNSVLDTETGIEGIAKISRSNKLEPNIITNYTKVVFKGRLEILAGTRKKSEESQIDDNYYDIDSEYVDLIIKANMYYDKVIIDLDENLSEDTRKRIIDLSDLVIVNCSQNFKSIEKLKEEMETSELLQSPRTLLLVGRYDKYSKYNIKNITRYLGERNKILAIPYNTLFFEASNEGSVPDLFIKLKKVADTDDRNKLFIDEVKRASENILYRLQELQARM